MPNPVLYILPENHKNQQDQERKSTLINLATFDAINVLLENTYFHDNSGQSANLYGIEEQKSHQRAAVLLHYINAVSGIKNLSEKVKTASPQVPQELQSARVNARQEVGTLEQKGSLPKLTAKQDLGQYIDNFPMRREAEIEEKHIFYKRNHKIANNIKNIVRAVLTDPDKPRVFVLSIGAKHLDSTNLNPSVHYQGKKDLPTILGNTITAGSKTVQVIYGTQTVITLQTIAENALELSDDLPWTTRYVAQLRLKVFLV